ncbi:cytochrome P450 [Xylariaceae sp. FL1651]|nr:cytochrome P450 [Xylariaceae sp. FL1651]
MFLHTTVVYTIVLALPYCLFLGVYRVYFHPLRQYPGPLAAKLSDLYAVVFAAQTALHIRTWQDHLNYVVAAQKLTGGEIYRNDRITKSHAYLVSQRTPGVYSLWNAIDQRLHRSKRKLVGQVTNERSMRAFEPIMIEEVDSFVRQIFLSFQSDTATPINMTERCKWLGMDIVGHLSFAYSLNLQTDPTYRFIVKSAATANYFLNMNMQMPLLAKLRAELWVYLIAVVRGKSYLRTIQKMIKARLSKDRHVEHDFYSVVAEKMAITNNDTILSSEIWSEAIFFLTAGGDTTSTSISALFFYLARNPRCYHRLAEEIRSSFSSGAQIRSGSQLANCSYLRACFDEALRMSPPLAGTLWREQVTYESAELEPLIIDGHIIPQGTQIGVNTYSLHHNEQYFPHPFDYLPERWLPGYPEYHTMNGNAFAAFSVGPRGCAGKAMAYLEASLVVAKTLWYFDFEQVTEDVKGSKWPSHRTWGNVEERANEYQLNDIVVATHDGPWLKFYPRPQCATELGMGTVPSSSSS